MCHQAGGPKSVSLLADKAYSQLVSVPSTQCDQRARVAPHAPESSYLIDKMQNVRLCSGFPMPPEGILESEKIAVVTRWICAGAKND